MDPLPGRTATLDVTAPALPAWLVVALSDDRYAFSVGSVREVLEPRPLARLPGCGPEVCGLVGVRGRPVTIFDLGFVLGTRSAISLPEYRLIMLEPDGRRIGFAVDHVVGVARCPVDPAGAPAPALGRGEHEGAAFTVLDARALAERLLA